MSAMAEFSGNREMRDQVLALLLSGQKTTARSQRRAVSPPPTRRRSDSWTPGTHLTPGGAMDALSPVTPDTGGASARLPTDADVRLAEITAGLVAASDKERRQTDTIRRLALQLEHSERHIRDLNTRGGRVPATPAATSGKDRERRTSSRRSRRDVPAERDLHAELDALRKEKREWQRRDSASRKEARDVMALLSDIRRSSEQVLSERDGHLRVIATLQQQLHESARSQAISQPPFARTSAMHTAPIAASPAETPPSRRHQHFSRDPSPSPQLRTTHFPPPSPHTPASELSPPSPHLPVSQRPPPSPQLPSAPRRVLRSHGSPLSERVPRVSGELLSRTGSLPDFTRASVGASSRTRQREESPQFPTIDITQKRMTVFDETRGAAEVFKEVRAGEGAFDGAFDNNGTYGMSPGVNNTFEDETVSVGDVFDSVRDIPDHSKNAQVAEMTEDRPESETPPRNAHTVAQLYKDVKELLSENRDLRERLKRSEEKNESALAKPAPSNALTIARTPVEAAARLGELDDELRVLEGVVECLEFSIDTEEAERLQQTLSTIDCETRTLRNGAEGDTESGTERSLIEKLQVVVQRVADIRMQIADKYGKFLADFGSPAYPEESITLPPGATLVSLPDTDISLSRTILKEPPPGSPPANTPPQPGTPPPAQ